MIIVILLKEKQIFCEFENKVTSTTEKKKKTKTKSQVR